MKLKHPILQIKNLLRQKQQRNVLWFVSIVMVGVALFVDFASQSIPQPVNSDQIYARLDNALQATRQKTTAWLTSDNDNLVDEFRSQSTSIDDVEGLSVMLLENDTVRYWSRNPFHTDLTPFLITANKTIIDIEGRQVLVFNKRNTQGRVAAAILVLTDTYNPESSLFPESHLIFHNIPHIAGVMQIERDDWTKINFHSSIFYVSSHSIAKTPMAANVMGWLGLFIMLVLFTSAFIRQTSRVNAVKMWIQYLCALVIVRGVMMLIPFNITTAGDMVPYFAGWRQMLFSPFNLLVNSIFTLALSYYFMVITSKYRRNLSTLNNASVVTMRLLSILLRSVGLVYFHWALIENIYSDAIEVEFFRMFSINTPGVLIYISVGIYMTARLFQCNLNRTSELTAAFRFQVLVSLIILVVLIYSLGEQLHGTWWMVIVYSVLFRFVGYCGRWFKPTALFSISVALTSLYFTTLTIGENNIAKQDKANEYLSLLIVNRNNVSFIEPEEFADFSYAYLSPQGLRIKSNNQSELGRIQPYVNRDTVLVTGRYTHLIHPLNNVSIVVSYREASIMDWVSMFCYLFLIFFVLSLLLFRLLGIMTREQSLMRRSLIVKIQFMIVVVIVLVLFAVSVVSVNFSVRNAAYTQRQLLNNKIRSLSTNLGLYQSDKIKGRNIELDTMLKQWYDESGSSFGFNMAIYSASGVLLSDDEGFRSPRLLDSEAYRQIIYKKTSYFVSRNVSQDKSLLVIYLPAYYQNVLIGFMSVSFIDPQDYSQVHPVLEGMFNIFVIILVVMLVLSMWVNRRIMRPIGVLHNAMATVGLMRKIPEDKVNRMDLEIYKLVRQYNKMIDYLEESYVAMARYERESAWQEMARRMAHEIKNPLTPMKLKVQMLQRFRKEGSDDLERKTNETLKLLLEQIDIIAEVVDEFRDFASMRENNPTIINLSTVVRDVAELYDRYENIEIRYVTEGCEPIWAYADGKQLSRVVGNLCKNSAEAMVNSKQGSVLVSLRKSDDLMAVIRVSDNGPGMTDEIAARLFEPNFTTKERGSGLGLVISRQIVENYGGKIWFENNDMGGATFVITLPLKEIGASI